MGACKNCKGTLTMECGEFIFAPCVVIQAELNEVSEFSGEDCVTLHDVIPEIYDFIAGLYIDDTLDLKCLTVDGEVTHQKIEQAQIDEICEIKETLEGLNCINGILELKLTGGDGCVASDLDLKCLDDGECGIPLAINTLGDLLQAMIDKICDLETRVTTLES